MGTLTCVARELDALLLECSAVGKIRKGLALPDRVLLYKFPRNDYHSVLFIQEPSFCLPSQNGPHCHLCHYNTAILESYFEPEISHKYYLENSVIIPAQLRMFH